MLPTNEEGSELLARRQTSRLQQDVPSSPRHTAKHLHASNEDVNTTEMPWMVLKRLQ